MFFSQSCQALPARVSGFSAVPSFAFAFTFEGVEGAAQNLFCFSCFVQREQADLLYGFYVIPVQSLMGETFSC